MCVHKVFPADVTILGNCSSYWAVAGKGSDTETWLGAYWGRDKVDWWPVFLPTSWHHVHILPFYKACWHMTDCLAVSCPKCLQEMLNAEEGILFKFA